jgi:outer membrane lipoprotein-sorting protein
MRGTVAVAGALAVVLTVLIGTAAAQPSPPSAAAVLGNVQQFYANASHLTALFRQVVTNTTFNTTRTSNGKLWVAKPALFRLDYFEKTRGVVNVSKTFAFDGTTLWLVDHKNKKVFQNETQSGVFPAAVSFLTDSSSLSTQFNVALSTAGKYGGNGAAVLELTPKQPSAQYKQLLFVVDPSDWHISESIVIDSNGDTNEFDFYNPDLKSPVKQSWFQVNPASIPTYKVVVIGHGAGAGSGSAQAAPTSVTPLPSTTNGSSASPMSKP